MLSLYEMFVNPKYKNKFLIHLHHADKVGLHYDIRIEHNGKLASWACRHFDKLLSGEKKKILVIQQPDHELHFFDFEGEIKDTYGKGKIEIWDKGDVEKHKWTKGSKTISFYGRKFHGTFSIIKYPQSKPNLFLMFRSKGNE